MNSRRYSRLSRPVGYDAAEGENHPMLLHGAGMATIAAACTDADSALAMTVIMLLLCAAMSVVYMAERGEYRQPMRAVLYLVPSALLCCGCGIALNGISPATADGIGMYLPVAAADAMVLARLQPDAPFVPPARALPEALGLWWLYAVMALPVGALRELLTQGTLFGQTVFFRISAQGMERPFAGFLLLGFALAFWQRRHGGSARKGTVRQDV